jgi:hypothetical protein
LDAVCSSPGFVKRREKYLLFRLGAVTGFPGKLLFWLGLIVDVFSVFLGYT